MVASQDALGPPPLSPVPATKLLVGAKPSTPASRNSLEKKMNDMMQVELQPMLAKLTLLYHKAPSASASLLVGAVADDALGVASTNVAHVGPTLHSS